MVAVGQSICQKGILIGEQGRNSEAISALQEALSVLLSHAGESSIEVARCHRGLFNTSR